MFTMCSLFDKFFHYHLKQVRLLQLRMYLLPMKFTVKWLIAHTMGAMQRSCILTLTLTLGLRL